MRPLRVGALEAAVHEPAGARATVLTVHGIASDLDGGGLFVALAERLASAGLCALRFSFRGHGASEGDVRCGTLAGQVDDLREMARFASAELPPPLLVVAASFGAVPLLLCQPPVPARAVVLWNPVLDVRRTILSPELPWGLRNFGPDAVRPPLGPAMLEDLRGARPDRALRASAVPTLLLQAEHDDHVPVGVAVRACEEGPSCDLRIVEGADHAFAPREDVALSITTRWLASRV